MKKLALHWQILIGMIAGIALGLVCANVEGGGHFIKMWVKPLGPVFINLLKMVAIPLIIASLIKGVSDLRDMSKLSKIGSRTMGLYICTTMIATSIGLVLANVFNPGGGISAETKAALLAQAPQSATKNIASAINAAQTQGEASPIQVLVDIIPANLFNAMTDNGQMLQVIFFVLLFAVALVMLKPETNPAVLQVKTFFDGLNDVILKMIDMIMYFAPFGVFALLAALVTEAPNADIFIALGKYAGTVLFGLALLLGVDSLLVYVFTKRNPVFFFKAIAPAQLVAFSSSSSAATMPITMECTTKGLGVDEEVASFVIPVGATVNMDGTALYQAVATVFIAQAFGNDLSVGQQLSIVVTATLASIGSAAVPGAGMLMLVVILQSVGIDPAAIALISAIDRPLDMCRTIANITGDMSVAMVVSNSLGKLHPVPSQFAPDDEPKG